jgi:hypothetical protein
METLLGTASSAGAFNLFSIILELLLPYMDILFVESPRNILSAATRSLHE